MNFNDIIDSDLPDNKVVLFLVVMDGTYDLMPGYRKNNQFYFPDSYPMAPDIKPEKWTELPQLQQGDKFSWE